MKKYEGMFVVDTREVKKDPGVVEDQINALITKCNGEVVRVEEWDERKLAYEISGTTNGSYYLYYFTGEPDYFARDLARYHAVTADDVRRTVTTYLLAPKVILSVVPDGDPGLAVRATEVTP